MKIAIHDPVHILQSMVGVNFLPIVVTVMKNSRSGLVQKIESVTAKEKEMETRIEKI